MKDMKIFYWKLLLWQTIIYGLLYLTAYLDEDSLTTDGKFLFRPFVLTGYCISVLFTFIIPMIKQFKKK